MFWQAVEGFDQRKLGWLNLLKPPVEFVAVFRQHGQIRTRRLHQIRLNPAETAENLDAIPAFVTVGRHDFHDRIIGDIADYTRADARTNIDIEVVDGVNRAGTAV